jgi:hypothetical protein
MNPLNQRQKKENQSQLCRTEKGRKNISSCRNPLLKSFPLRNARTCKKERRKDPFPRVSCPSNHHFSSSTLGFGTASAKIDSEPLQGIGRQSIGPEIAQASAGLFDKVVHDMVAEAAGSGASSDVVCSLKELSQSQEWFLGFVKSQESHAFSEGRGDVLAEVDSEWRAVGWKSGGSVGVVEKTRVDVGIVARRNRTGGRTSVERLESSRMRSGTRARSRAGSRAGRRWWRWRRRWRSRRADRGTDSRSRDLTTLGKGSQGRIKRSILPEPGTMTGGRRAVPWGQIATIDTLAQVQTVIRGNNKPSGSAHVAVLDSTNKRTPVVTRSQRSQV